MGFVVDDENKAAEPENRNSGRDRRLRNGRDMDCITSPDLHCQKPFVFWIIDPRGYSQRC